MPDIVLRDRSGNAVEYPGVEKIKLNTVDGGEQGFASFTEGELIPGNIAKDIVIGGVTGTMEVPTSVEKTVELDFSAGAMEVTPGAGQVFSKVNIPVPENLVPSVIAEGVDIAGIVGTLVAGGGSAIVPRIEYTKDDNGNIIAAKLYGFTSVWDYMLYGISTLESVDLTESPGILSIGQFAFQYCTALKSITLPDEVAIIGRNAFYGCTALESVTLPDALMSIGINTFRNCSALTSITIPANVTSIGAAAFNSCSALTSATFKDTAAWYVGTSEGATTTEVSSSSLADTSKAATYLKTSYVDKYWTKV